MLQFDGKYVAVRVLNVATLCPYHQTFVLETTRTRVATAVCIQLKDNGEPQLTHGAIKTCLFKESLFSTVQTSLTCVIHKTWYENSAMIRPV
jgi:hypothetical protein